MVGQWPSEISPRLVIRPGCEKQPSRVITGPGLEISRAGFMCPEHSTPRVNLWHSPFVVHLGSDLSRTVGHIHPVPVWSRTPPVRRNHQRSLTWWPPGPFCGDGPGGGSAAVEPLSNLCRTSVEPPGNAGKSPVFGSLLPVSIRDGNGREGPLRRFNSSRYPGADFRPHLPKF